MKHILIFNISFNLYLRYLLWILLRLINPTKQIIPSWTGFNIKVRDKVIVMQSNIGYLDSINSPATDIGTVYEMMKRAMGIKEHLNLDSVVCVLDQAMYAKACEVKFKKKDEFQDVLLFMGTFHTIMMLLGVAGTRFGDAGFRDVIIQSSVVAEGSIEGVLSGKMYNRSIYAHKVFYEALQRILVPMFKEWYESNGSDNDLSNVSDDIQDLHESLCQNEFDTVMFSKQMISVHKEYNKFIENLKSSGEPLTKFWLSYLDLIATILDLVYATRVGDWPLFLETIKDVIVWAFAYDRYNYSRYLLVFLGEMLSLESTHPDVYQAFSNGYFSVQLSKENPFGRNESDKTIENTINKDTKTPGGLTGFSLNQAATDRWVLNAKRRAECYNSLKDMLNFSVSKYVHHDLQESRIKKDEANVTAVLEVFETTFSNPFTGSDLISLSTGNKASIDMEDDLLNAWQKGEVAKHLFVKQRLTENPSIDFYNPIKKLKLKTFSNLTATKKVKVQGKEVMMRADKELLGRMAIIGKDRVLDPKEIFSYPLGPIPWALAGPLGQLRKTNKAVLMKIF